MTTATIATHDDLRRMAEFDHAFRVNEDGTLSDATGCHAPEVYHSETDDVEIHGAGWEALTGFTGQYGYRGAVLHASEYIGGGLADHILSTPGIYAVVAVEVLPDEGDPEPEPAGWAVVTLTGCDGCDLDPWAPPHHYGTCPLA